MPETAARFPLLPILVACASGLAHKQLSSIPAYDQFAIVALVLAAGFGKSNEAAVHAPQELRPGLAPAAPP
jgi:hypothetical protein